MPAHRPLAALFVAFGLVACGSKSEPAREPPPIEDTVFRDLAAAKERAKAVEGDLQKQKEERDRVIEAAQSEQ